MKARIVVWLVASGVLLGCSSTPPYPNRPEKNVTVTVDMEDAPLLTSVEASAGINDIGKDCESRYRGYVNLTPGSNRIGLAPGQMTYLVVEISHSRFGRSSSFSRGTLFTPETGKRYEVDVNYADDMFDFRLYEVTRTGRKKLKLTPASACKPSK